jgi:hypothetical protein
MECFKPVSVEDDRALFSNEFQQTLGFSREGVLKKLSKYY